jgi:DNA-directed RNA polymerase subunit delta
LTKKRLVKSYEALSEEIIRDVKLKYPSGYEQHLVKYTDKEGKIVSALPFETDEAYYLIRMTVLEAKRFDSADDDDDDAPIRGADLSDLEVENEFDGQGEDDDDMADGTDDENDHIIVTRRRDSEEDIADDSDY